MAFCTSGINFTIGRFPAFESQNLFEWRSIYMILSLFRGVPFMLKPLFGFLSDIFPVFGYRFKSYIIANLFLQLVCSLVLYFFRTPSLILLLVLSALLNLTAAYISCLLEGVITMVTKMDSKISFPEFTKKSKIFQSKSHIYIGLYQFLFLLSEFIFTLMVTYFELDFFLTQKIIYPLTAALSFFSGIFIMIWFKERKVRPK